MKELLQKWAELEPERCRLIKELQAFAVKTDDNKWWGLVHVNDLVKQPILVQEAIQRAIVSRGWSFELKYNPDCPDPNNPYDAIVDSPKSGGWGFGNDGFVEPLLRAYLDTLEEATNELP